MYPEAFHVPWAFEVPRGIRYTLRHSRYPLGTLNAPGYIECFKVH